jgi:hypothetical protein
MLVALMTIICIADQAIKHPSTNATELSHRQGRERKEEWEEDREKKTVTICSVRFELELSHQTVVHL